MKYSKEKKKKKKKKQVPSLFYVLLQSIVIIHLIGYIKACIASFGCLNISFNLNFTFSSLRRNSDLLSTFKHFPGEYSQLPLISRDLLSTLILSFCRRSSKSHIVQCQSVGFLPIVLQFDPQWRQLIFYSFLIFQDCFWLF